MSATSIVAIAGDAGGARAIEPVIRLLTSQQDTIVRALAYGDAVVQWRHAELAFGVLDVTPTQSGYERVLVEEAADVLVAGTSVNGIDLEKQLIAAARSRNIPSVAVLDFWSNYAARFANAEGDLRFLPDVICVMDERARAAMERAGVDPSRLVVTGQPAFDHLSRPASSTMESARGVRERLRVGPEDVLIVFASQPLSSIYGERTETPGHIGFTERSVLAELKTHLEALAEHTKRRFVLLVRPHPKEEPTELATAVRDGPKVRVIVSAAFDPREICEAADLVTGMSSSLIVESAYLGRPTISLQPGLRLEDPVPTNQTRQSRAVFTDAEFRPALAEALLGPQQPRGTFAGTGHEGATARVAAIVLQQARSRARSGGPETNQ